MFEKEQKVKKYTFTRIFFRAFVDVKQWVDYDVLVSNTQSIWKLFKKFFSHETNPARTHTYEESISRLNLNKEHLDQREKVFLYSTLVYLVFAVSLFIYFFYQLVTGHFYSTIISLIFAFSFLIFAYREHFWYMQMRKKKLGCDFYDWIDFILRRAK